MNKRSKSVILSENEIEILREIYSFSNPVETLEFPDGTEEKESLLRVLNVLREECDSSIFQSEKKDIGGLQKKAYLAFSKYETLGKDSLTIEDVMYCNYYLTTHLNQLDSKGNAKKPIHVNVADSVLVNYTLKVLNQDVYIYNEKNGTYEKDNEGKKTKNIIRSYLNREFIEDKIITGIYNLILNDPRIMLSDNDINKYPREWIHFLNGFYDPKTDDLRPHNPSYNSFHVIPYEYNPNKFPSHFKRLNKWKGVLSETIEKPLMFDTVISEMLPDKQDQVMLLQYLGYMMTLRTDLQKFLMLCGSGGTGKSTLLSLVEEIIGKKNISNISLQGLQERFSPSELYLKQANICADIPLTALSEVDTIKKLTGEDTISADRKFKSNFSFKSYARLIFSANDIPLNLSDKSNAFYRRMLILKMDKKPSSVDPNLAEKLKEEIPHIITKIIEEYYLSDGEIDESTNSKELVKQAYKDSDTVEAFLDDCCYKDDKERVNRTALYDRYKIYCFHEGRIALNAKNFYKALKSKGIEEKRGKTRDFLGVGVITDLPYS